MAQQWKPKGTIKSKLLPIEIATNDYWEASDDKESPMVVRGKKRYFTWAEAVAIRTEGWRLPTKAEWAGLCVEFGEKGGDIDHDTLTEALGLSENGYANSSLRGEGDYGYYWSSTIAASTPRAYYLVFGTDITVDPFRSTARYCGLSVRLVRDIKE